MFETIALIASLMGGVAPPLLHVEIDNKQLACLTEAVYFEAGSESYEGKLRVAETVINRVNDESKLWPNDICAVVNQPSRNKTRPKACQFSYTCNNKSVVMKDNDLRIISHSAALSIMSNGPIHTDVKHFAQCGVKRAWMKNMKLYERIGKHCFYKWNNNAPITPTQKP